MSIDTYFSLLLLGLGMLGYVGHSALSSMTKRFERRFDELRDREATLIINSEKFARLLSDAFDYLDGRRQLAMTHERRIALLGGLSEEQKALRDELKDKYDHLESSQKMTRQYLQEAIDALNVRVVPARRGHNGN